MPDENAHAELVKLWWKQPVISGSLFAALSIGMALEQCFHWTFLQGLPANWRWYVFVVAFVSLAWCIVLIAKWHRSRTNCDQIKPPNCFSRKVFDALPQVKRDVLLRCFGNGELRHPIQIGCGTFEATAANELADDGWLDGPRLSRTNYLDFTITIQAQNFLKKIEAPVCLFRNAFDSLPPIKKGVLWRCFGDGQLRRPVTFRRSEDEGIAAKELVIEGFLERPRPEITGFGYEAFQITQKAQDFLRKLKDT